MKTAKRIWRLKGRKRVGPGGHCELFESRQCRFGCEYASTECYHRDMEMTGGWREENRREERDQDNSHCFSFDPFLSFSSLLSLIWCDAIWSDQRRLCWLIHELPIRVSQQKDPITISHPTHLFFLWPLSFSFSLSLSLSLSPSLPSPFCFFLHPLLHIPIANIFRQLRLHSNQTSVITPNQSNPVAPTPTPTIPHWVSCWTVFVWESAFRPQKWHCCYCSRYSSPDYRRCGAYLSALETWGPR